MNDRVKENEMQQIVKALEAAPSVVVPDDFAARMMARLPQQPQRRYVLRQTMQTEAHVVAGMLVLAPHTAGSETWLLLQGLLFTQLVALLLWMGISYKRLW